MCSLKLRKVTLLLRLTQLFELSGCFILNYGEYLHSYSENNFIVILNPFLVDLQL